MAPAASCRAPQRQGPRDDGGARPDAPPRERQGLRQDQPHGLFGNPVQRRCSEPGRRQPFHSLGPWRGSRLSGECGQGQIKPRAPQRPATRCNDVAPIGRFRHFAGSTSFVTTPRGLYGQARTADHSQRPTSARWCSNSASKANSPQNQRAGTKNRIFLEGDRLRSEVKGGAGSYAMCPPGRRRPNRCCTTSRRRVTAQQRPGTALRCAVTSGVEAGNGVADEEAERLGGASRAGRAPPHHDSLAAAFAATQALRERGNRRIQLLMLSAMTLPPGRRQEK